jgi:hypothetical protein
MLNDEFLGLANFLESWTLCFVLGRNARGTVVDESAGGAEVKLFSVEELKGTSVTDGTDGLISAGS